MEAKPIADWEGRSKRENSPYFGSQAILSNKLKTYGFASLSRVAFVVLGTICICNDYSKLAMSVSINRVRSSMKQHPDKTFIGRISKGFDFLGYHISPEGLSLAKKTVENFIARAIRLHVQSRKEG